MRNSTIVGVLVVLVAILGGWYWWAQNGGPAMPGFRAGAGACTMDARVCPDGSAVGRTGPNCAFAPCPAPAPTQPTLRGTASTTINTGTAEDDPGLGDASVPGQ